MSAQFKDQTRRLFVTHRVQLVNYAVGILGGRNDAEDVVQEAFLKFDTAAHDKVLDEPIAYLFRIVRNLSIDLARRGVRERNMLTQQALAESDGIDVRSPEAIAGFRSDLDIVEAALRELPERTRVAVTMHRVEGCKLREIAERLGVSTTLAHTLVRDGLEHCRRRLDSAERF